MEHAIPPADTASLPPPDHVAQELARTLTVAGFWRRIIADILDMMMVSVVFWVLSGAFPAFFYAAGPHGRVWTYGLAVAYFTLAGSYIGKGQTLGKRLLGIVVTGADGRFLGVKRSFVRSSVLLSIWLLSGWGLPVLVTQPVASILALGLFLGGTLALLYGYVFNRAARQGPHDLIVNSFVVRLAPDQIERLTRSRLDGPGTDATMQLLARKPMHTQVTLALYVIVTAIVGLLFFEFIDRELLALSATLTEETPFFLVQVSRTDDELYISAWYDETCGTSPNGRLSSQECNNLVEQLTDILVGEYDHIAEITRGEVKVYRKRDTGSFFSFQFQNNTGGGQQVSLGAGEDEAFFWRFRYSPPP